MSDFKYSKRARNKLDNINIKAKENYNNYVNNNSGRKIRRSYYKSEWTNSVKDNYSSLKNSGSVFSSNVGVGLVAHIFGAIVLFFICIVLLRANNDGSMTSLPTFTSFLNLLSSVEPIEFDFNLVIANADWGVFEFLRIFLEVILSVVTFALEGIYAIYQFLYIFIRWIFILP